MRGDTFLYPTHSSFALFILHGMGKMKTRNPLTRLLCIFGCLLVFPPIALAKQVEHDGSTTTKIVLQGDVKGGQNNTYIEVPFRLPEGLQRVTITFHYTEKDK